MISLVFFAGQSLRLGWVTSIGREREGQIFRKARTAWTSCSQSRVAPRTGSECRWASPSWAAGRRSGTCDNHACPPCPGYTCKHVSQTALLRQAPRGWDRKEETGNTAVKRAPSRKRPGRHVGNASPFRGSD